MGLASRYILNPRLNLARDSFFDDLAQIEDKFSEVRTGMSSGVALKTIFEDVLVFPEESSPGVEKWCIWGYDIKKMIEARAKGSYPFTLTIDTQIDRVIEAKYEYNTRFD